MLVVLFLETGQSKPMYKLTFLLTLSYKTLNELVYKSGQINFTGPTWPEKSWVLSMFGGLHKKVVNGLQITLKASKILENFSESIILYSIILFQIVHFI